MAILKRSHNETSMKNKYDALKELEKGVPQKEVALRFGVQKSTLSTWKRNKTKIEEAYHEGLASYMLKNSLAKSNEPSMLILEKNSEVKYTVHICLFVHPPLTPYSGR